MFKENIVEHIDNEVYIWEEMAWSYPKYDRRLVNQAGEFLVSGTSPKISEDVAFEIIDNWRSSHNFPLNTFQVTLRRKAKQVDPKSLVAQRIKRLSSIKNKLILQPGMKLAQMQDIGGCRAIVSSLKYVEELVEVYKRGGIKHKLVNEKDYIEHPKPSGYRSVHLVYKFYSEEKNTYNDLKIEIQIRTILQHAWATAVETVGTFTKQSLKSSQGKKDWLRFFELMGTVIAFRERTAPIPNTPTKPDELRQALIKYEKSLRVRYHLEAWAKALKVIEPTMANAHYYLLTLDPVKERLSIIGYERKDLNKASEEYLKIERKLVNHNSDSVLVSTESLEALKRAYPNYYLDTTMFLDIVRDAVGSQGILIF
jgi:hypothetical protein